MLSRISESAVTWFSDITFATVNPPAAVSIPGCCRQCLLSFLDIWRIIADKYDDDDDKTNLQSLQRDIPKSSTGGCRVLFPPNISHFSKYSHSSCSLYTVAYAVKDQVLRYLFFYKTDVRLK